nr:type II toxin-antitoxin system VapC family toxin [[Phormidium] sp. ETS-05]
MGISYLLDTHILLWWLFNDPKLSPECREIIGDPNHCILVSSASAWEIATKYRIGKLP